MKVACVGNMNNNFFSIVRYLRDLGIDAYLVNLKDEFSHFLPSADAYDKDYLKYTRTLKWGDPYTFLRVNRRRIIKNLEEFDYIIGCGPVPAFLYHAGRVLDIFIPYGNDIYRYPFFKLARPPYTLDFAVFTFMQNKGIRNARYVHFDITNVEFEAHIKRLNIDDRRLLMSVPFIYTPIYNPVAIQKFYRQNQWYPKFQELREQYDLIIFHHSRLSWCNIIDKWSDKGNDKLLYGYADFIRQHRDLKSCIVLFNYGSDIEKTKALIQHLGIERHVAWFPVMSRKDLMIGINHCDIGVGEMGMSWFSYGVIFEFMAMAKPVIHYRDDRIYHRYYPEMYPMVNANSRTMITEALNQYLANPSRFRKMGEDGRIWFQKYAVDRPLKKYLEIFGKS